jgi:hypothetical protein
MTGTTTIAGSPQERCGVGVFRKEARVDARGRRPHQSFVTTSSPAPSWPRGASRTVSLYGIDFTPV